MNLEPLEDRVIVKPYEPEDMTAWGLVIPDAAKVDQQRGTVLAVGPGRRSECSGDLIPFNVGVGDTVIYSKYVGTVITIDGDDLLILSSRDALAVSRGASS